MSTRWSSHFGVKIHFFQLLLMIKVNLVDKMKRIAYLCVILIDNKRVKHKKLSISAVFN